MWTQITDWFWCTYSERYKALFQDNNGRIVDYGSNCELDEVRLAFKEVPDPPVSDEAILESVRKLDRLPFEMLIEYKEKVFGELFTKQLKLSSDKPLSSFLVRIAQSIKL